MAEQINKKVLLVPYTSIIGFGGTRRLKSFTAKRFKKGHYTHISLNSKDVYDCELYFNGMVFVKDGK